MRSSGLIAFISRMDDGECFFAEVSVPGEFLSWQLYRRGQKQITRFIQLSGEDGSILMLSRKIKLTVVRKKKRKFQGYD